MDIRQILALIILAIFYGCYYFKNIMQRRQNIQTNHIGKGKTGMVKKIEISLGIISGVVPTAEVLSILFNFSPSSIWTQYIGIALAFLGDIIFIIAVITMKNNWRAGISPEEETELVTNGIYRISRNPAFLGFDLVYIGILMIFFHWPLFIITILALFIFHLQIVKVEEPFLISVFGEDYINYKNHTNRYLGRKIIFLKEHNFLSNIFHKKEISL